MAARENQGLQIALIVFVTLTLILSLTTFVFFRNYQSEQQKLKEAANNETAARTDAGKAKSERDQLMQYVGLATELKIDAVTDAWKKDMESAGSYGVANLPDAERNYKKLVTELQMQVRKLSGQLAKSNDDLRQARANYDAKIKEFEDAKRQFVENNDKTQTDYATERKRIADDNESIRKVQKQLSEDLIKKDADKQALQATKDNDIAGLQKELTKTQTRVGRLAADNKAMRNKFNVNAEPDGRIVLVNQHDRLVSINLGTEDRLRKRVTFSVYDPSTTDVSALNVKKQDISALADDSQAVSEAKKKGTIEVINITGPHMAECRILSDATSSPLLPNDLIFTPLWRPGQQDHFALVGMMDIDGDGIDDREKVHDLIRINGGIIDAETDAKGNALGEVTVSTRYLVRGKSDRSTDKLIDEKKIEGGYAAGGVAILKEAEKLGVETVDLAKFLDMMGYTPPPDEDKIVKGRTPTAPAPGEPVGNFRARIPPEKSKSNSAF